MEKGHACCAKQVVDLQVSYAALWCAHKKLGVPDMYSLVIGSLSMRMVREN